MPKDFTEVERRSCNNEDVVYNDSLICAVLKSVRIVIQRFNYFCDRPLPRGRQYTVKFLSPKESTNPLFYTTSNRLGVPSSGAQKHEEKKSYFISDDMSCVFKKFVQDTMNRPDKSFQHRRHRKRGVMQTEDLFDTSWNSWTLVSSVSYSECHI